LYSFQITGSLSNVISKFFLFVLDTSVPFTSKTSFVFLIFSILNSLSSADNSFISFENDNSILFNQTILASSKNKELALSLPGVVTVICLDLYISFAFSSYQTSEK